MADDERIKRPERRRWTELLRAASAIEADLEAASECWLRSTELDAVPGASCIETVRAAGRSELTRDTALELCEPCNAYALAVQLRCSLSAIGLEVEGLVVERKVVR